MFLVFKMERFDLLLIEMKQVISGMGFQRKFRNFIFLVLSRRFLLDIKLKKLSRQLDICLNFKGIIWVRNRNLRVIEIKLICIIMRFNKIIKGIYVDRKIIEESRGVEGRKEEEK